MQRKADCSFQFTGNFKKRKKQLIFLIKHVIIKLEDEKIVVADDKMTFFTSEYENRRDSE